MQFMTMRKLFASLLVLLCLGFAPHAFFAPGIAGPGTPSLARERPEVKIALLSQRNAVQALVSTRDPLPPSAGGAIVAVLPTLPSFGFFGQGHLSPRGISTTVSSTEPDNQRARSPPLS